jgi:two-component system response regulator ArlR
VKKVLVLVVEKDRALAAVAAGALREAGFEVAVAADAADGLKKIYQIRPDVVIAGTDLPPVNGEDACQRIRQASYLPFIVLGDREEVVETLELGADAYIVKPASGQEVVARVKSIIRRRRKDGPPEGGARLRIERYLPGKTDGPGGLSPTECRLGSCLLYNEGRLLDYPQLITEVWGGKAVSVDTLHFYMRRLRRKLANFNIFAVRGVGYSFLGGGQQAS